MPEPLTGIEPVTFRLQDGCSTSMSYRGAQCVFTWFLLYTHGFVFVKSVTPPSFGRFFHYVFYSTT